MYVIFRDDIISSDDIRKRINGETEFTVETDLTKATKREDVMSFKLSIAVENVDENGNFDWNDENSVDNFFEKAESLTSEFLEFFPKYTIESSSAYKWDEFEDKIYLIVVIANVDITKKKLQLDILKRMMKQVD